MAHKNVTNKESILNIDQGLQDEIFEREGFTWPQPETDDMGRVLEKQGDKLNPDSPVQPYYKVRNIAVNGNDPGYINRIMVGTATTGNIRIEWALARWGQIIPTNWSQVQMMQYMGTYAPIEYQIADAQNLIVKEVVEKNFEWLLLLEHDVILPVDAFVRINAHIRSEDNPVVSGIYFTKSIPAEPMIYRGRGNSYFTNWKLGDKVYADGVPTGCLLIHGGLLRKMWEESAEYVIGGSTKTRRVFETPRDLHFDPLTGQWNATTGTSDLDWCSKVMKGGFLEKSGWKKHAKMRYPFLVDTNIYCKQIDEQGVIYPVA